MTPSAYDYIVIGAGVAERAAQLILNAPRPT